MTDEQPRRGRGRPRRLTSVVAAGVDAQGTAPEQGQSATPARRTNRPEDKQFIKDAAAKGEIRHIDGFVVWSGHKEDLLHPYQVPPDERRCRHLRQMKDGVGGPIMDADMEPLKERCPNWAMLGANLCVPHAKGSKAVMDQAREMIAGAAPALVGQLIRNALSDTVAPADQIKAINSLLDRFGLRGGIEVGPDMPAWREIMDELGRETGVTE